MIARLEDFKGVWQAAGDSGLSGKYAYDAYNVNTERGALASAAGYEAFLPPIAAEGAQARAGEGGPQGEEGGAGEPQEGTPAAKSAAGAQSYEQIGTLARLYRRDAAEDQREVFVACTLDGIYTYTAGDAGWTRRLAGPLYADAWDWVAYETVDGEGESAATCDVLILTNAKDGMIALYGSDLRVERKETPAKFGVLGRHAERIWGAGVEDEPDSLYYSRPYDPFNWTADEQNPELGGGQILQPTWDGDRFIALRELGAYLIALKTRSIYQVRGTDPSSFVITQEYGADAPQTESTIAVDGTRMYYLTGGEGEAPEIGVYDGVSAQLLAQDALHEVLLAAGNTQGASAVVCGHVYYLALPVADAAFGTETAEAGGAETGGAAPYVPTRNNTVIEYDTIRRTFMVRRGIHVRAFLTSGGQVYFTSSQDPYRVYRYGAGTTYGGQPIPCRWQTGWMEGATKRTRKSAFILRFFAQGGDGTVLRLTLETERRRMERAVSLCPEGRSYRVRMPLRGVRWRLRLESEGAQAWRIPGGIEVSAEEEELE